MDPQQFNAIEDEAVAALVEDQIGAGLTEITSGEFRRDQWDKDFWFGLDGISRERVESGHIYQPLDPFTDTMRFRGRIAYNPDHPFFNDFAYLKEIAKGRAACRQTLPSPANLYPEILSMTDGHPEQVYSDSARLLDDISEAYNRTMLRFYKLGCRLIQFDDTACGMLLEDNHTKRLLQGGMDLHSLHGQILGLFDTSVDGLPHDMEISLYLSGGDNIVPGRGIPEFPDDIMPKVLSRANVSKFFIPFDIGKDNQLEMLRHVPDGKSVVIGLADAHSPLAESPDDIRATVAKASEYIQNGRLPVSPKTGFKLTSYVSRGLTYDSPWRKIAHLRDALQARS